MLAGVLVLGLLSAGGFALFGGSSSTSSNTPTASSAPVNAQAKATLDQALATAEAKGSFYYVSSTSGSTTSGTTSATTVGEAGRTSGIQHIVTNDPPNGSTTFTVIVSGSDAYFRGGTAAMVEQLGVTSADAARYTNQWVSLVPSDGTVYSSVYAAVKTRDALVENIAVKPQHLLTKTSAGRVLESVSGSITPVTIPGQGTDSQKGTATLVVSASTHLPVRYVEHTGSGKNRGSFTITFSHFGAPVDASSPPGAIPFTTVISGGGSSGQPVLT